MVVKKTYFIFLIIIIYSCGTSEKIENQEYFNDGITTKTDCLTKHGNPDFKYTNAFTHETWAYNDTIKSGVHCISFYKEQSLGYSWYLNFEYPDTTETIYKSEIDTLNVPQLAEGEYLIKYFGKYGDEYLIRSFLNKSIGTIKNSDNSTEISVEDLNEALNEHKIYSLGSIKKNIKGNMLHVGFVQIWTKENDKLQYLTMSAVNWFDNRYESVMQEIWKLVD